MIKLFKIFWLHKESNRAKLYLLGLLLLIAVDTGGIIYLSYWRNDFWSSLELKSLENFLPLIGVFSLIAFALVLSNAYNYYFQGKIALQWRQFLNHHFIKLAPYLHNTVDNFPQRIQEDCWLFPILSIQLVVTVISSLSRTIGLTAILIQIGFQANHPALFIGAVVAYATIGTLITTKIGRSLIGLKFTQQVKEASYRTELANIFKIDSTFREKFKEAFDNMTKIIFKQKLLSLWTSSYNQLSVIFPLIVIAPFYFSGLISFGTLMQANSAMSESNNDMSCIVNSYDSITDWLSSGKRLSQLFLQEGVYQ